MAKILMISPVLSLPPRGGASARVLALTRAIREQGHELHFARIPSEKDSGSWEALQAEFGIDRFHLIEPVARFARSRQRISRLQTRLLRRIMKAGNSERQYHSRLDERAPLDARRQLEALQKRLGFDVVIAEYVYTSKLLTYFPPTVRKIIDTHDVFAERHRRMATAKGVNTFYSISAAAEHKGLQRADAVVAIQEQEAAYFAAELGKSTNIYAVSHFIEVNPIPYHQPENRAAFFGSNSLGNVDTMQNLIDTIIPRVVKQIPDFKLFVAGTVCAMIADSDHVVKLGPINDPAELYARAPLLLTPTNVGTGVAIKALDALGLGVPVVTSATGARGHSVTHGGVYVTEDADADGFSANVVRLLQDSDLHQLASNAALQTAKLWNEQQELSLRMAIGAP